MSESGLECRALSVAEYLGGGLALASIALIPVGGAHMARPQASVPAVPLHYAAAAIETNEAVAKLSLASPKPAPGETRDKWVSDPAPVAALSSSIAPIVATALSPALPPPRHAADHVSPLTARWPVETGSDAAAIKQHVIDAGPFGGSAGPVQDLRSRDSRASTGLAGGQQRNMPNPPSVRAAASFVGGWATDIGRCRADKKAPLVISSRAAKTASGECDFGSVAREAANRWRVAAICTADGRFWRANIALKLDEPHLTWSSERGTETYVRCRR